MYLKVAILVAWFVSSYVLLVFVADAWWQAIPLAIALGLAMAGIGFNVQHDGAHHAYSRRPFINRLMASTLDFLGASSYLWHLKHNIFHHSYPNITGADEDITGGALIRLSPHKPWNPVQRFQYLYAWLLYGLLPVKWQFMDDFRDVIRGRIAAHKIPRPTLRQLFAMLLGKAVFATWALVIPLCFHSVGVVALYFMVASYTLGVTLSLIFQLGHCVVEAEFPPVGEGEARTEQAWAIHQIRTTVDFAQGNRLLSWYLGGLNYQIEHHLFPHIGHVHYPALAPVVEQACAEYGVPYRTNSSFLAALASHARFLRVLGKPGAWVSPTARDEVVDMAVPMDEAMACTTHSL
jgi:linoleoyl-CoA desaturase